MRRKIVAGNWKMNKTTKEAIELINELIPLVASDEVDVVFCPPFLSTIAAVEATKGTNIKIGAQNMYFEDAGAYTGEVSAQMLKEVGVEYVILGHSERRGYFKETDEDVNKKVLKAFESGLIPIMCCGEVLEQRDQGVTIDLVRMQVKIGMQGVTAEDAKKMVIAYEPVWAIGTGRTATADQAEEVCGAVRKVVEELYNKEVAEAIRIQYGGSVNGKNAGELFAMPNIDGGLVGGSAIKADFGNIVNFKK